jgi:hypothetical protein
MSLSNVTIPINTSVIPVDTRTIPKVLFLPTVSTNAGRYLLVKDYYGTSSNSSITISTTGTDLLDDYNFKYTLSNAFGSVGIVSDGLRSWRLLDLYNGGLTPASTNAPPIVSLNLINNVDAATYTSGSPWVAAVGNNQTIFGSGTTTTLTPGGSNAIVFNGSGYGLDTVGYSSSSIANFTMDIWFFADANVSANLVGNMGQGSQGGYNIAAMSITGNTIYVGFWQGSLFQVNCGSYTANRWTHVCYTYSGTTVRGYVNGIQVNTGTSTRQVPGTDHFGVGSAGNPYGNLTGRIGAYKLYSRALSASEVTQNYNALAPRFGLPSI